MRFARPMPETGSLSTVKQEQPETKPLAGPAIVMAIGTVLSRATGLGRIAAMAYAIGVAESRLADTYNIANTLPNVIYELVLGGVLTAVFIPVVVDQIKSAKSQEDADRDVSALVMATLVVLAVVSLLAVVAAPWLMRLFTFRVGGELGAEQQELATFFFRIFAAQIFLYGYSAIADGLLNAHDRFALPMFAPILNNVVVIGMFIAFGQLYKGEAPLSSGAKWLLGAGTTAGVAAMAAIHWPFVRRLPFKLKWVVDFRHEAVRKLTRLSGWTIGYVIVNQIGFGVALVLANGVQGGPTAYFVAFAFFQLPYGVVAVSIMTALVPTLARLSLDKDLASFSLRVGRGLRATAVILLPMTAATIVLALPGIEFLLQRGVMSASSSQMVARVLQMFAIGILPFAAWVLFLRAFYAMQDSRTPFMLNLIEVGTTIVLDIPFFWLWKIEGLALAHTCGYIIGSLVAGIALSRRTEGLGGRHTMVQIFRVLLASAAAGLAMWGVASAVNFSGWMRAPAQIVAGLAVGAVVFFVAAKVMRVEDLSVYKRLLRGGSAAAAAATAAE